MILGIVGSEAAKFTEETERRAREIIRGLLTPTVDLVVSGGCHLGGIDIWAEEEARAKGISVRVFLPSVQSWSAGYMPRNVRIAAASDKVVCITVARLPDHYTGMRFEYCYHCKTDKHVKSGGCWTVKQALAYGRQGEVIVI